MKLQTPDCTGVEIIDNTVMGGSGKIVDGLGRPAVMEGNGPTMSGADRASAGRAWSIYEWQQKNVK